MFVHNIDPVLLSLGPFQIRYYGLFFVIGFIFAYFILYHLAKKRELGLNKDDAADIILYLMLGTVLGARIFYVLVYNLPFYFSNPSQIIAVWNGGLSFHGGLLGAVIGLFYITKKKKVKLYDVLDILTIPLALSLALGRVGNFINGELYGRITDVPWAVKFPDADGFRHPSQLYASFKDFTIFMTLWIIKDKKLPSGFMTWLFITMYPVFRFIVGFFRQPDPQLGFILGPLSMGQILSLIMFPIGAFFLYRTYKKSKQ